MKLPLTAEQSAELHPVFSAIDGGMAIANQRGGASVAGREGIAIVYHGGIGLS